MSFLFVVVIFGFRGLDLRRDDGTGIEGFGKGFEFGV